MRRSLSLFSLSLVAMGIVLALAAPTAAEKSAVGVISSRISGCDYFVVETKSGFDLLEWFGGYDPDKGDVLIGAYESYGFHKVYDKNADRELRIYTEDYLLAKTDALEQLADKCE